MADEETELPKVSPEDVVVKPPAREIPGVQYDVAKKIEKMLKSGRRYFGSSGASLTHQVHNPDPDSPEEISPELAKIGLEGERDTTEFLKDWMKDKPGVVLVDSVHINTKYKTEDVEMDDDVVDEESGLIDGKDTDHVLLIGDEVILIDTKRWKKKKAYSVGDNGQVLRTNKAFPGGDVRMKNAIYIWLEYLSEDAVITGVVLINAEQVFVRRNKNWYSHVYRLVEIDRMKEYLDKYWAKVDEQDRSSINSTLVSQVALSAIKPFDIYKKVFNEDSLNQFMGKGKK